MYCQQAVILYKKTSLKWKQNMFVRWVTVVIPISGRLDSQDCEGTGAEIVPKFDANESLRLPGNRSTFLKLLIKTPCEEQEWLSAWLYFPNSSVFTCACSPEALPLSKPRYPMSPGSQCSLLTSSPTSFSFLCLTKIEQNGMSDVTDDGLAVWTLQSVLYFPEHCGSCYASDEDELYR